MKIISYKSINDYISLTIIPLMCMPLIMYFYTNNFVYLYLLCAVMYVIISIHYIKYKIGTITKNKILYRPYGCTNCSLINTSTDPNAPAFPSGHVGITTFLVYTLCFITKNTGLIPCITGSLYIALMAESRYAKKCHNIFQIVGGLLYGSVCALLFNKFIIR